MIIHLIIKKIIEFLPEKIYYNNNNNGESLEKKYIKDPGGNPIEAYVKKTKYNNGSVPLEYV